MLTKDQLVEIFVRFPHLLNPDIRHDFSIMWRCKWGCPNGDPDNPGPRQMPDGRLIATDAAFKRMLRDYWEEVCSLPIYISRAAKEGEKSLKDLSSQYPTAEEAIRHYFDVRMFGAVYLAKGKGGKGGKGGKPGEEVEAGEGENAQILGPVQIGIGGTVEPVEIQRMAVTRILQEDSNDGTFGQKAVVESADIVHEGRYSGYLGRKRGVTEDDMRLFWEGLINGPEMRRSAMSGERATVRLTVKSFGDAYGMVPGQTVEVLG
jgi:CRISPR-associated protein Csd2